MTKKEQLLKNRPAFHVDKHLIEAAKKAAKAFDEEEKALREALRKAEYAKI